MQVVFTPGQDKCFLCGQMGHMAANCEGKAKRKAGEFDEKGEAIVAKKPFQVRICDLKFLHVIKLSYIVYDNIFFVTLVLNSHFLFFFCSS